MKETQRMKNYRLARDRTGEELSWARAKDFLRLKLRQPVILVNGSFDLLHSNHMRLFWAARRQAGRGTVIVAMDSDEMIERNKGHKPIMSWVERGTAMQYMPVDYLVEIKDDEEFLELVSAIKPTMRVRGQEYRDHPSRVPQIPSVYVRDGGLHTSELIRRCQERS